MTQKIAAGVQRGLRVALGVRKGRKPVALVAVTREGPVFDAVDLDLQHRALPEKTGMGATGLGKRPQLVPGAHRNGGGKDE